MTTYPSEWDDDACDKCRAHDHAHCIGRTEPDCDLVGDHYQQTNRCFCPICERYETISTKYNDPRDTGGTDWPVHVQFCVQEEL